MAFLWKAEHRSWINLERDHEVHRQNGTPRRGQAQPLRMTPPSSAAFAHPGAILHKTQNGGVRDYLRKGCTTQLASDPLDENAQ
jgi:hypothetical protein